MSHNPIRNIKAHIKPYTALKEPQKPDSNHKGPLTPFALTLNPEP